MIDRLAELENYDYAGEVHSASRRGVLPWLFKPELYNPNNTFPPYQLSFFTPENTAESESAYDLQFLWEKEIARACTTGYGPGHVLGAFYKEDSIFKGFEHPDSEIWKIQLNRISAWYGNPTSPQRYELYQKAIREKQFISHQSSIKSDQIEACDDGFIVQINGNPIKFDTIFNAASCARSLKNLQGQIRSPLISNLDERGSIKWDNLHHGIILAGQQQKNGLYYAGPYSFPGKWGVETFRTSLQETALQSLNLQQRLQLTA